MLLAGRALPTSHVCEPDSQVPTTATPATTSCLFSGMIPHFLLLAPSLASLVSGVLQQMPGLSQHVLAVCIRCSDSSLVVSDALADVPSVSQKHSVLPFLLPFPMILHFPLSLGWSRGLLLQAQEENGTETDDRTSVAGMARGSRKSTSSRWYSEISFPLLAFLVEWESCEGRTNYRDNYFSEQTVVLHCLTHHVMSLGCHWSRPS